MEPPSPPCHTPSPPVGRAVVLCAGPAPAVHTFLAALPTEHTNLSASQQGLRILARPAGEQHPCGRVSLLSPDGQHVSGCERSTERILSQIRVSLHCSPTKRVPARARSRHLQPYCPERTPSCLTSETKRRGSVHAFGRAPGAFGGNGESPASGLHSHTSSDAQSPPIHQRPQS